MDLPGGDCGGGGVPSPPPLEAPGWARRECLWPWFRSEATLAAPSRFQGAAELPGHTWETGRWSLRAG